MSKTFIFRTILLLFTSTLWLYILYTPIRSGTLHLANAPGPAELLREGGDSGIQHIRADTLEAAIYMQGFAHAQDRLW